VHGLCSTDLPARACGISRPVFVSWQANCIIWASGVSHQTRWANANKVRGWRIYADFAKVHDVNIIAIKAWLPKLFAGAGREEANRPAPGLLFKCYFVAAIKAWSRSAMMSSMFSSPMGKPHVIVRHARGRLLFRATVAGASSMPGG